jgi:acetyl-CoA carboxylase biotin carboxyl carrier protein
MAEPTPSNNAPFDLDRLKQLVEMMESHDLTEVNLRRGDEQWRLRRGPREVVHAVPQQFAMQAPVQMHASAPAAASAPAPASGTAPTAEVSGLIDIKSPTVGTFYASPSPGEPPFITVGSVVTPETIVCLIEAMKVFNQIPAEVNGTIAAILVNSGDAIEFGQPLFRVKP